MYRKQILATISKTFPPLTTEVLRTNLFPDDEDILSLKLEVVAQPQASGPTKNPQGSPSSFIVYCNCRKQPLFVVFDIPSTTSSYRSIFLPTVYALAQFPDMMPLSFTTVAEVLTKLQNGADLMLAGANISAAGVEFLSENEFPKETIHASVCVDEDGYPVGIGRVLMSSEDLKYRLGPEGERKGRLLEMVHLIGDELWALGDKSVLIKESKKNSSGGVGLAHDGDKQTVENEAEVVLPAESFSTSSAADGFEQGDANVEGNLRKLEML